jgi:hypothetical protein
MSSNWTTGSEAGGGPAAEAEATLRIVANLPAPEGLEERVHEALRTAPRAARVLPWPARLVAESAWVRSAAAAAIAFVVVGGGWGVYSRVQTAKVIEMPSQVSPGGGFANAGAKEKTLNGPVIHRPDAQPVVEMTPKKDAVKKAETEPVQ